ncbi:MAG TPA: carboxypeptidase regulatory-like domain-containing protein [Anaerolineae bacterium]|nr:carboxypeptidase regulatory-like domain-containing protein [Anaerolineae bacterium]
MADPTPGAPQPDQLTISGKVHKKGESAGLPGATVLAVDDQQRSVSAKADEQGQYTLQLAPGNWEMMAWHEGWVTPSAIDKPTNPQDIALVSGVAAFKVAGTVRWQDNRERAQGALVKATPRNTAGAAEKERHAWTDDDGDFAFEDGLAPGAWDFVVLHEKALPGNQAARRLVAGNISQLDFDVWRKEGRADATWGLAFFIGLCAGLVLLVALYIALHAAIRPSESSPGAQVVNAQVKQAQTQIDKSIQAGRPISDNIGLAASVAVIRDSWQVISTTDKTIDFQDKRLIQGVIGNLDQSVTGNRVAEAQASLTSLTELAKLLSAGFWWTRQPWLFLEVLLWGLAGVLVNLIFTTGNYLRWHRFYVEGIFLHTAQLLAVPLLALVFVFLLSQVTLTIEIAGMSDVRLDLSDPRILAAVSFLISAQPWALWDFARQTGGRLTGGGSQTRQSGSSRPATSE